MAQYRIKQLTEEFLCPTCGAPVVQGDVAWQEPCDGPCYCSKRCADGMAPNKPPHPYQNTFNRIAADKVAGRVAFMTLRQARAIFGSK